MKFAGAEHRNSNPIYMANTYTQLYIHLVFAVKNRNALLKKAWKHDLEKYITGIIQRLNRNVSYITSPALRRSAIAITESICITCAP
ncbi:MAG: hypothetical protein A2275_01185 [Bacteroidetes bacterium RIFOXYA12_FULL_35_11]|nr:MAG: hypothetical protein A2X01_20095 [Bacteroidetes bacterium GWF2_35_48]OFY74545.1 MAG: hypothetical protein A2275_01185 [Bacteroidetes bacterium RIFOXYA12_FULL_35_11]OFY95180.1 MAG: hypothetical protein A2309_14100 [Bacteroidetes bacterium RIFOXYB2_FULL_35_7]OFY95557.1 MAG: hypothetical protein A2491_13655 [Bacteroidetes bacterium RIFOXYC12_FULL_35_7]